MARACIVTTCPHGVTRSNGDDLTACNCCLTNRPRTGSNCCDTCHPIIDRTPRYVPETFITAQGEPGRYAVVNVVAYPAGQHPTSPIVKSMTAVRCTLANGAERWFGCESAYIDASLRMVVVGTNPRDEVRMRWEVAS